MRRAQDVRALGHEVNAAEDNVVGLGAARGSARQLERVADEVGELDHFVALIVVSEDHNLIAQQRFGRTDTGEQLMRRNSLIVGDRPRQCRTASHRRSLIPFVVTAY